jgi:hypothetical protein
MKTLIMLGALLLSSLGLAKDIQFNDQDQLNVITMEGYVNVRCNNGQYPSSQFFQCYSSNIEGGNYQKLQILTKEDVDWVYLKNSTTGITKNSRLNSESTETNNAFNLWIRSLTQRALLDYGVNEIEYRLTKNRQDVLSGTYRVNVIKSEQRVCPQGFLYYGGRQCPDRYSICRDYFYRYNYCK